MVGILAMYDPPRNDTKATLAKAKNLGIQVKMITGDHIEIAKQTCIQIGLHTNILKPETLESSNIDFLIKSCDGFAEV